MSIGARADKKKFRVRCANAHLNIKKCKKLFTAYTVAKKYCGYCDKRLR